MKNKLQLDSNITVTVGTTRQAWDNLEQEDVEEDKVLQDSGDGEPMVKRIRDSFLEVGRKVQIIQEQEANTPAQLVDMFLD